MVHVWARSRRVAGHTAACLTLIDPATFAVRLRCDAMSCGARGQVLEKSDNEAMRGAAASAMQAALVVCSSDAAPQLSDAWLACDSETQAVVKPALIGCVEREADAEVRAQVGGVQGLRGHGGSRCTAPVAHILSKRSRLTRRSHVTPQLCTTLGKFAAALVMASEWNELLSRVFQWAAPVSPAGTAAAVQAAAVAQTCAAGVLRELGDCIVLRHADKLHFFVQLFERLLCDRAALPFAVRRQAARSPHATRHDSCLLPVDRHGFVCVRPPSCTGTGQRVEDHRSGVTAPRRAKEQAGVGVVPCGVGPGVLTAGHQPRP